MYCIMCKPHGTKSEEDKKEHLYNPFIINGYHQ